MRSQTSVLFGFLCACSDLSDCCVFMKLYLPTTKSQNFNFSIVRYFRALVTAVLEYPDHLEVRKKKGLTML